MGKQTLDECLALAQAGEGDKIKDAEDRERAEAIVSKVLATKESQDAETKKSEVEAKAKESKLVGAINGMVAGAGLSKRFKLVPVDEAPDDAGGAGARGSASSFGEASTFAKAPADKPADKPAAGAFPHVGEAFGGTLAAAIGMGRSANLDAEGILAVIEKCGSRPAASSPFLAHEVAEGCVLAACAREKALPGSTAQETPDGTNAARCNALLADAQSRAPKAK